MHLSMQVNMQHPTESTYIYIINHTHVIGDNTAVENYSTPREKHINKENNNQFEMFSIRAMPG